MDREFWQYVAHWRMQWQTTSVFLPWELHEEYSMQNVGLDDSQAGIKIVRRNINNLTLMAKNKEELKSLLMRVNIKENNHTQKIKWNQMQDFCPIIWSPDPCLNSSGSLTHILELRTLNRPTQGECPHPQDAHLGCPGEVPVQCPELSVLLLSGLLPSDFEQMRSWATWL